MAQSNKLLSIDETSASFKKRGHVQSQSMSMDENNGLNCLAIHRATTKLDRDSQDFQDQQLSHYLGGFISQSKSTLSVLNPDDQSLPTPAATSPISQKSAKPEMKENHLAVGIRHDPLDIQFTKEYDNMQRYNSSVERHGLTLSVFRGALSSSVQPKILHFTFHGDLDDETDPNNPEFTVVFDGTPTLPLLLASNGHFQKGKNRAYCRDYFAAIAFFIETEVDSLLYPSNGQHSLYRVIDANSKFFERPHVKELVTSIAWDRFGCKAQIDEQNKRIVIWYGQPGYDRENQCYFHSLRALFDMPCTVGHSEHALSLHHTAFTAQRMSGYCRCRL